KVVAFAKNNNGKRISRILFALTDKGMIVHKPYADSDLDLTKAGFIFMMNMGLNANKDLIFSVITFRDILTKYGIELSEFEGVMHNVFFDEWYNDLGFGNLGNNSYNFSTNAFVVTPSKAKEILNKIINPAVHDALYSTGQKRQNSIEELKSHNKNIIRHNLKKEKDEIRNEKSFGKQGGMINYLENKLGLNKLDNVGNIDDLQTDVFDRAGKFLRKITPLKKSIKNEKSEVHLGGTDGKTKDVGESASVGIEGSMDEVDYETKMKSLDNEKYQRIVNELKEGNYTYERDEDDIYYLAEAIKNENKYVGMDAIRVLEKIRNPQTILILREVIRDNKNKNMRMHAIDALGNIDDPRVVPILVEALGDEDQHVCWSAAKALENIGKPAVSTLIKAFREKKENVRKYVIIALRYIDDPRVVPILIEALRDDSEFVRVYAAEAFENRGNLQAVLALIEALGDDSKFVREHVVKALEKILNLAPHIKEYFSKKQINLSEKAMEKMEMEKGADKKSFKKELINAIELYFIFEKHNIDFSRCLEYLINNQRIQDIKNLYSYHHNKYIPEITEEVNFIEEPKEKIRMLLHIASNQQVYRMNLSNTAEEKMQKYRQKPTEKEAIKALKNIDNKIYGREQHSKDLGSGKFIIEEKSKSRWRKFFDEKIKEKGGKNTTEEDVVNTLIKTDEKLYGRAKDKDTNSADLFEKTGVVGIPPLVHQINTNNYDKITGDNQSFKSLKDENELISEKYLFSLELTTYKKYLKDGEVEKELKKAFEDKKILLDKDNAIISKMNWIIKDRGMVYLIKDEEGKLNVYSKGKKADPKKTEENLKKELKEKEYEQRKKALEESVYVIAEALEK
ncbi:MAG: HEAT repeat domain-containing protein, partial [Candidatus Aenigmarchaeota archaeon]|nr:HEAT repeat domain-containing protein [Candidatus Aenigmarchaeota archaeon]